MRYAKLRGLIRSTYGTQAAFARALDLNPATVSSKLNGGSDWKRGEMEQACRLLDIKAADIPAIFFAR